MQRASQLFRCSNNKIEPMSATSILRKWTNDYNVQRQIVSQSERHSWRQSESWMKTPRFSEWVKLECTSEPFKKMFSCWKWTNWRDVQWMQMNYWLGHPKTPEWTKPAWHLEGISEVTGPDVQGFRSNPAGKCSDRTSEPDCPIFTALEWTKQQDTQISRVSQALWYSMLQIEPSMAISRLVEWTNPLDTYSPWVNHHFGYLLSSSEWTKRAEIHDCWVRQESEYSNCPIEPV